VEVGGEADVRVTSAAPHFLRGDLLAVRPPRISARQPARVRIPVIAAPA
jgi:hypothetical protein